MAEPFDPDGLPCVFRGCDKVNSTCIYTCIYSDPFLSPPPPPPPPPPPAASASHVAPFLIATVCILGIAFLLLTTCTIILRCRFRRRRRIPPATASHAPNEDDFSGRSVVDHPIWNIATVGLQQSVIDSITAFEYKKMDGLLIEGCDCSVCLTEFEDGENLRLLPKCSHAFHVSCIDTWLRSHKNCPVCRAPVVNDNIVPVGGSFSVVSSNSGNFDGGEEGEAENSESLDLERGDNWNDQSRERGDELGELPIEGTTRIAEILKKNRELRIASDLGQNYRFRGEEDDVDPIRRSISFNSVAASAICRAMSNVCRVDNEGCSSNTDLGVQEDEEEDGKKKSIEKASKRGTSMSGLLMKSSSIGRSLQKGPVSMKRSISSSSKLFSFRRSKSQASILPL